MRSIEKRLEKLEIALKFSSGECPDQLPGEDDSDYFLRVLRSGVSLAQLLQEADKISQDEFQN